MRDFQRIDVETTWNRARVLLKLDALRAPADSDDPKVVAKFLTDHPRLAEYVYIVYPRLAKALFNTDALTRAENGFTLLPGVTHKGHDVYVYWNYDGDPNEAWALVPPEFMSALRDNRPYEPTPQERAQNRARRLAREKQVQDAKQARLAKIAADRTALMAQVAAQDAARRATEQSEREKRRAAAAAIKGKLNNNKAA